MKIALIIILGILTIFFFVQALIASNTDSTEQQEYEVIESDGQYEIRYYPAATMASVDVSGEYGSSSGQGFRILASYIFGSNSTEEKIAMTAPVHMEQGNGGYNMSFVMPSGYDTNNLPKPDNGSIRIHESAPAYTATLRFGGYSNEEKIEEHKQKLMTYLEENKIEWTGPFVFLGYNPPYQMVNRRNEVMVQIKFSGEQTD